VSNPLEELSRSIGYGKLVHDGLKLAIVGRPNVGKSSLFNRLVEREHAIVTATPGTTRDLVSETISIAGIPVKLIDTAGLRDSEDEAEKIGVRKSYEALADADVVLVVTEASTEDIDDALIEKTKAGGGTVIVAKNKADLIKEKRVSSASEVLTSALLGEGIDELRAAILKAVSVGDTQIEPGFLTNERQHTAVKEALESLMAAQLSVHHRRPHEVLLLELYAALKALDSLTGATSSEDILALIFQGFCIGK
jgi:tRNA modification GTPase